MEKGGTKPFFERSQTRQTPLPITDKLVCWLIFFIAITMAVDTPGISRISAVLAQFIAYIPQIIAAIPILILAAMLANFIADAAAPAFGFGGQETAAKLVEQWYGKGKEAADEVKRHAQRKDQSREPGSQTRGSRPPQ